MMLKRLSLTAAFALTASMFAHAQQTSQQAPPAQNPPAQTTPDEKEKDKPKADANAAPSIAGKWNISVETQGGSQTSVLNMKLDGKKVTGTITSQMGEAPISGEFADGKLNFNMTFEGGGGSAQVAFSGTLKDDGTITGTLDVGGQNLGITWKAERVKEK